MNNKDLISQYVDTGLGISRYQYDKLSNNDKTSYLRKIKISIDSKPSNLKYYYGELTEEVQLSMVNKDGYIIYNIIEAGIIPSEQVQLIAVTKNGPLINYILKAGIIPSEEVQLAAVSNSFMTLNYIIEAGITPSERVQLVAVTKNSIAIKHIIRLGITPSDKVIMTHKKLWGGK
jgi:hypothetical protein